MSESVVYEAMLEERTVSEADAEVEVAVSEAEEEAAAAMEAPVAEAPVAEPAMMEAAEAAAMMEAAEAPVPAEAAGVCARTPEGMAARPARLRLGCYRAQDEREYQRERESSSHGNPLPG